MEGLRPFQPGLVTFKEGNGMYAEYKELAERDGFDSLSQGAKDFIREYCDLGEIRFCDTCGSFIEGDFIWDMGFTHHDYCNHDCMDKAGYTRKDMLQDYYMTPYEGEEGYEELLEAKVRLDSDDFEIWLDEHYEEDPDAPVFWTSDQFPSGRNEGAPAEALEWLWKQTLKREETA